MKKKTNQITVDKPDVFGNHYNLMEKYAQIDSFCHFTAFLTNYQFIYNGLKKGKNNRFDDLESIIREAENLKVNSLNDNQIPYVQICKKNSDIMKKDLQN